MQDALIQVLESPKDRRSIVSLNFKAVATA